MIYGHKNWVPMFICGTTPSYLAVRNGKTSTRGNAFTEHDVRGTAAKVCLIGQTLVRELFEGQSPIGKEIRMQNVSMRVMGVLERKGANMVGMDQDDIVLAPWTTIKYRVSGTTLANTNQSAAAAAPSSPRAVNTLSNLYPSSTALYPAATTAGAGRPPQPVRFANVDQTLRAGGLRRPHRRGHGADHRGRPPGSTTSRRARTTTSTSATWPRSPAALGSPRS